MANRKLFFSYSRIDGSESAIRLATDLKKKGFDVWIDQEDIRAGLEWDTEIEKALEGCDTLLFLGTEKSVVSNNVLDEVYYALEQHKKVIPLIFANSKMPFRLNRLQHIDFTRDYAAALALLVNELEGNTPAISCTPDAGTPAASQDKPFLGGKSGIVAAVAGVAILIAAVLVFRGREEKSPGGIDQTKAEISTASLSQMAAGKWSLTQVDPAAASVNGYLNIDTTETGKANIKAYMQFYYPDSKAATSLSVFNSFAGCASCTLGKEMKLEVEDVSVSSHSITRAQKDQPDGRKAGDTIADHSATRSIGGTATLQFVDSTSAIIKVQQKETIELRKDLSLEPFVYTFYFRKRE